MKRVATTAGVCGFFLTFVHASLAAVGAVAPSVVALKADPESFATVSRRDSGRVSLLGATLQSPLPESIPAASTETRARGAVSSYRSLLIADSIPLELQATSVEETGPNGIGRVRFQQSISGIPVRGAVVDVALTASAITAISSTLASPLYLPSAIPVITAGRAQSAALSALSEKYGPVAAEISPAHLEFLNLQLGRDETAVPSLAWYFEAVSDVLREQIWIDAYNGVVLKIQPRLTEARNRRTFDANGTASIPTAPTRTENQGNTGITDVDRAHDYAGDFYNYYLTEHGRDSFDGKGATIDSVVRFCPTGTTCPYRNAFWNGIRVTFGTGFTADDVVAHELTHAVIDYSAVLFYENESGALNESYADIFGETIDLGNGKGGDAANQRWYVGEDLPGVNGGIRNLMTPSSYSDPARIKDATYYCGTLDNGGVHTNSGVSNHAFALMTDGGTYNGYTVSGIGLTKAAKIHYRSMTVYLKEFSTYLDDFNALIQSCNDLIGVSGISPDDCAQVKKAVLSVEMSTKPCSTATPPAAPPSAPAPLAVAGAQCPSGQSPVNLFQDDFENTTSGKWTTATLGGVNHWVGGVGTPAIYFTGGAANGTYSLHATTGSAAGNAYVIMSQPIASLPANTYLQFESKYEFEPGIDGGIVEYSTNNGSTWVDASPLFKSGRGYDAGLANGLGNAIGGRIAFSGSATSYAVTRADLNSLAGQNILFRFRSGTDSTVAAPGWWIDNVSIFNCAVLVAGATVTPTSGIQVSEAQGSATFTVVLKSAPTSNVTINLSSSDTTEATVSPAALVFTPTNWNVAQTVTIAGVDDAIDDDNVPFTIITAPAVSADAVYNGFNAPDVTGTTLDNDTAGVVYSKTSGLTTLESGTAVQTDVRLASEPVSTVTLSLVSGDTTEGTVSPASISFSPLDWNTPKVVTITGVNDDIEDGDITYSITTTAASVDAKYNGIPVSTLTVVNRDNDAAAIIVAPNGGLITSEGGATATFVMQIGTQPMANVSVSLRSSNTNEGTVSPASVTFTPTNWSQAVVVTVTGVDDVVADGNVTYTIITDPAVSTDTKYSGLNPSDISVTNQDNESPNIVLSSTDSLITTEAGGKATFTVVLTTRPTADVTLGLSSNRTTEGTVSPSTLVFTTDNWNQPAIVTVTGVDDSLADGDISYAIVFTPSVSADPNYNGRRLSAVVVTNTDNESASNAQPTRTSAQVIVAGASRLKTTEDGGAATFTVRLSKAPTADVTIRLSTSNSAEARINVRQLVFTPENAEQPQSVTVVGRDDADKDGDVTYSVILAAPVSDDSEFSGLSKIEIIAVNSDNEKSAAAGSLDIAWLVILVFLFSVTRRQWRTVYGR